MSKLNPRVRRCHGLSLVELMVAVAVGLMLTAGAISIFLSNKRTYEITDDLSRLQENARFALDSLLRDLRMAGNVGCGQRSASLTNAVTVPSDGILWDLTTAVEGLDEGANTWSPSGRATTDDDDVGGMLDVPVAPLAGTDAITIRYATGPGLVLPEGTNIAGSTTDIPVDASDDSGDPTDDNAPAQRAALQDAQLAVITDCGGLSLFEVAAVGTTNITSAAAIGRSFERPTATPPLTYPRVMPFRAVRYFVGDGSIPLADERLRCTDDRGQPVPTLFRTSMTTAFPEPVVCGVENMQILYGVDTNADGQPDNHVTAPNVGNAAQWRAVVSVRIGLLLRTVDQSGTGPDLRPFHNVLKGGSFDTLAACETDAGGADRGCFEIPPADATLRVRRRVFSTTVYLRNRS